MKILKRLIIAILSVCTIAAAILFTVTGCQPEPNPEPPIIESDDPAKDGYKISLYYPDGNFVKGSDTGNNKTRISVVLVDDNGKQLNTANEGVIRENGVATINYKIPGEYKITVINLPIGYVVPDVKTSSKVSKHRIDLTYKQLEYKVNVLMPDGTPANDITVKLVENSTDAKLIDSFTTNNEGKGTSNPVKAGVYNVVLDLPDTLSYVPVSTDMNGKEINIKLVDVNPIKFDERDELDEQGRDKWIKRLNSHLISPFEVSAKYYGFTAHVVEGNEIFYSIHTTTRGRYNFHVWPGASVDEKNNYIVKFYGTDLSYIHEDLSLTTENGTFNRPLDLDANSVYYFSITTIPNKITDKDGLVTFEPVSNDIEFVLSESVPFPLSMSWRDGPGTKQIMFDMNTSIIYFMPSESGRYVIESHTSQYDTSIQEYSKATNKPLVSDPEDPNYDRFFNDNGGEGKNFRYETDIRDSQIGGEFYYLLKLNDKNINYPVEIQVSITRIGDASPDKAYSIINAVSTIDGNDPGNKYPDQEGTFEWLPTDGSVVPYQKANGTWVAKIDGKEVEVVVAISKELHPVTIGGEHYGYSFTTVESIGGGRPNPNENKDENSNNYLTVCENYDDYLDPNVFTVNMVNYTNFIANYAKMANSDGVVPLNRELKTFLERYMIMRGRDIANLADLEFKKDFAWLLGCGYYVK